MNKRLLSLLFLLLTVFFTNAQTIDIVGQGAFGVSNSNLTFSDLSTITKVEVGAAYSALGYNTPAANTVLFSDNDEGPLSVWKTEPDLIVKHWSYPGYGATLGTFEATFNTVSASGIDMASIATTDVHSFYAFVYRENNTDAGYSSYINAQDVFLYRSGTDDPYVYTIPINTASQPRNIKVKIPISELDDGTTRKAVIDITAGAMNQNTEVNLFNQGNSLYLGEFLLENVPGDVNEVTVSIISPNDLIGEDFGDSFFVHGVVVDVDKVNDDPGCTLTWGYWKTHSSCKEKGPKRDDTWDELPNAEETIFFKSGKDYCGVFATTPGKGGKYYILAHQYIAAELNFLNGADPTDASEAFNKAKKIFEKLSPHEVNYIIKYGGRKGRKLKHKITRLARILDDYNNGIIGPGHCDDNEEEEDPCLTKDDVVITPMPITSHGKIMFTATHAGRTGAYLFNQYGYPICPLYNKVVDKGEEVSININGRYYRNGTYYVKIWNGCCVVVKRIVIRCY